MVYGAEQNLYSTSYYVPTGPRFTDSPYKYFSSVINVVILSIVVRAGECGPHGASILLCVSITVPHDSKGMCHIL